MAREEDYCTCQLHCKAPPGGKLVSLRTWYDHRKQRELEEDMTQEERENQLRVPSKKRKTTSSSDSSAPRPSTNSSEDFSFLNDITPSPDPESPSLLSPTLPAFSAFDALEEDSFDLMSGIQTNQPDVSEPDRSQINESDDPLDMPLDPEEKAEQAPEITLDALRCYVDRLDFVRDYDYDAEREQWTEDEYELFTNPSAFVPALESIQHPPVRLSLKLYLNQSERCSEETYAKNRDAIQECYPDIRLLSFDQVRTLIAKLSGVRPLKFDQCINTCVAFVNDLATLDSCPECGEDRYSDPEAKTPRRRFTSLPLGPQIQAIFAHLTSRKKVRYRVEYTEKVLEQRQSPKGIQVWDDFFCGTDYLDLLETGDVGENDIFLTISMDGAQLYRDKQSDTWFGVATILDFPPEFRSTKRAILPLFAIGGPNPPKNYDSFLAPTLAHLNACQKNGGLPIWDALTSRPSRIVPWLAMGTADTVGITELNGWVGHHGRNGCHLLCPMPGRHKPNVGTYYPVMLRPDGPLPPGSSHDDIDINTIRLPTVDEYNQNLAHVLSSSTPREFERRRKETGIHKPTLLSALHRKLPPPKIFTTDLMHLFLNVSQLIVGLFRGTINHGNDDTPDRWDFAVLRDPEVWKEHGQEVSDAILYLPVCLEERTPRNPAEKINSGYKACEYLVYIFSMCSALLYDVLPHELYQHFCKLVAAVRIVHKYAITLEDLRRAHQLLMEFVFQFEILYVQRKLSRLHFVRPCIHALVHIVQEIIRLGCLFTFSQWLMERSIGRFVGEIRLDSDPYANLSRRMEESGQLNALYSIAPELFPPPPDRASSSLSVDIGSNYVLLHPRQLVVMDPLVLSAFRAFSALQGWTLMGGQDESPAIDAFARLLLPNGQIARSLWHEKKRPVQKVRRARNVKVSIDGKMRYAEVLKFFLVEDTACRYTLAAVRMFSEPDPTMYEHSFGTLSVCSFLGDSDIRVVDARWITEVVGMVPFRRRDENGIGSEFYAVEKLRSVPKAAVNNSEEDEEESLKEQ